MTALGSLVLLIAGYLSAFYAGFCLLGGPDGAILSRNSFVFGVPSLVLAGLLVFASSKFVPIKAYAYAPLLIVIIAWLTSLVGFHKLGFYVWLFGTTAASITLLAHRLVQLYARRS